MSKHDITLHHLNASRSIRIFWALEELGLEYKVKVYWRQPSHLAPPELGSVSSSGKAPALTLDGENITESAYIIQRLLALQTSTDRDVEITPSNDSLFWGTWAEGTQMNMLQAEITMQLVTKGFGKNVPGQGGQVLDAYSKWASENIYHPASQGNLDLIEKWLASKPKGTFFSGTTKPGLGDFMLLFAINNIAQGGRKDAGYELGERTREWLDTSLARPACQKAMERMKREEDAQKAKI